MALLYLTEQQSWVGREGDCLVIHLPEQDSEGKARDSRTRKKNVPLMKLEEVMVLGDITLTTPALTALLEGGVNITYLTRYGKYLGRVSPPLSRNSLLRLAQHAAHADPLRRHALARRFVAGKLRNMRTLLMRYNRATADLLLSDQIDNLKRCLASVEKCRYQSYSPNFATQGLIEPEGLSLAGAGSVGPEEGVFGPELEAGEQQAGRMNGLGELLGCEGAGSAAYFGVFARLIKCGWPHGFSKRVRRPPTDPVNALLSYGYTILGAQISSLAAGVGLDPYIGYLHSSRYGKPALALDLLEDFRPVIVDSVVLSLLNTRQLVQADFELQLNSYRLTEGGRRIFLQKFEERMQEEIIHPVFEYKVSYRRALELQARLLGKYLLGEVEDYLPFTVR
jgi:CRISPR-associated protein Cas1